MRNPFTNRNTTLKRTGILTGVALLVLIGVGIFLYSTIAATVDRIQVTNRAASEAAQKGDIARIVRTSIEERDDLVEEIRELIPPLTEVQSIEGRLEQSVRSLFTKQPDVQVGGSSPHMSDATVRVVQFTIKGRLRVDNYDEILRRLDQFPVLLEVETATLDLGAVASPFEGEGVFVGKLFARKASFE